MRLRAATHVAPAAWRQWARSALLRVLPTRLLMAEGPSASGAVCLSFDDGPDPVCTPKVMATLRAHRIRATFFLQGSNAAAHPELVRELAADGHDLGHHSWSHGRPSATNAVTLIAETIRTRALLKDTTGQDSRIFRPPHGKLSPGKMLRLWRMRQTIVLWTCDPGDVFQPSAESLVDWVVRNPPRSGEIVLLHEKAPALEEALPEMIRLIQERGLRFATISDWLRHAAPGDLTGESA